MAEIHFVYAVGRSSHLLSKVQILWEFFVKHTFFNLRFFLYFLLLTDCGRDKKFE